MNYSEQVNRENVPQHIAIIMDGNGRWAQLRGMERSQGHQAGAATVRTLVEDAVRLGVKYLTLYTLVVVFGHLSVAGIPESTQIFRSS